MRFNQAIRTLPASRLPGVSYLSTFVILLLGSSNGLSVTAADPLLREPWGSAPRFLSVGFIAMLPRVKCITLFVLKVYLCAKLVIIQVPKYIGGKFFGFGHLPATPAISPRPYNGVFTPTAR